MNRDIQRKQQIEALILKYEKTVYKLAYSYMKNRQDTDDIYQEVFLRFFRKKPEFESVEHEKAWFIRTTINCCKSYFLSGWVKRTCGLEERTLGQEDSYEMEGKSELFYAVMELPVKYRTVIHLFYYEGYTVKEIAELLEEKVTTITTRLARGREQLREVLDAEAGKDMRIPVKTVGKDRLSSGRSGGSAQKPRGPGRVSVVGHKETCIRY
ncbi:MAG: sigma-70 family RNA polymerase sigma factor [Lachnospiraceae bacterium]|jgi:RNA polymerase sigma-70 factor (ECF subfamily)|nr:sigma-70 family RNA polymerase sigma factor [Lachnospiraceae bacterium]